MIQTAARQTLARLRVRQLPANAANAAAAQTCSNIARLQKETTPALRAEALSRVNAAKVAFENASGVAWYSGLGVRYANYVRWKPYQKDIDDAVDSLNKGDQEAAERDKRTRYISSWVRANAAVEGIAQELGSGSTNLTMVLGAGLNQAQQSLSGLAPDLTPLWWLLGGALALQLVRK